MTTRKKGTQDTRAKKKRPHPPDPKDGQAIAERSARRGVPEEDLQGPPARDHVGEEAVGGTVATPDQNVVDELGSALGVPRAPDEEVRTSGEILERRDRYRWEQETGGDA
jgi:hypothetical protein